jgi:hypothetical protein
MHSFWRSSVRLVMISMSIRMLLAVRSSTAFTARPLSRRTAFFHRLLASTTPTTTTSTTQEEEKMPPIVKELPVKYSMEEIVSLCKRRGIVFPSSEIYNGYAGFYDYGPLGSELKKNIKDAWWRFFVTSREDVVGLDSSIIHNPATWKSSGECVLPYCNK